MNSTIQQLLTRRSIRNFTGEHVKPEDLALIIKAGLQAPSSIGAQQISLIITKNKDTIQKIAHIAGDQSQVATADIFITIVIDFNRTNYAVDLAGGQHIIEKSAEGILVGTVDAGIMCATLGTAANALGYGSTPIGGIRSNPQEMIDLLKLPQNTYPVVGITLGVSDNTVNTSPKPRIPVESFAMEEVYDDIIVRRGVRDYELTLRKWLDEQGRTDFPGYAEHTAMFYQEIYFRKVAESLINQGFIFQDNL